MKSKVVAVAFKVPWHNQTTKEKYLDAKGEDIPRPHYFLIWLWGMEEGSCAYRIASMGPRPVNRGYGAAILHK